MGGGLESCCVGRVFGLEGAVRRHLPNRTHDLRSGCQDHHPTKHLKTICCNLKSSASDDGRRRPKHVELQKLQ